MKLPATYLKDKKNIHVIIETPYKSRNKFNFDKSTGLFKYKKTLPAGMAFPCDFGFIPRTTGEDGDPLDALLIMDELTYPGCLVECRLIGVIKATQVEKDGREIRNDRFITVPLYSTEYDDIKDVKDINKNKINHIVSFFKNYNEKEHKQFKLVSILGAASAHALLKKSGK